MKLFKDMVWVLVGIVLLVISMMCLLQGKYPEATFYLVFSYGFKLDNAFKEVMSAIKEQNKKE